MAFWSSRQDTLSAWLCQQSQTISDNAAKTVPPQRRLLAGTQKVSFLTENHQQLYISDDYMQL